MNLSQQAKIAFTLLPKMSMERISAEAMWTMCVELGLHCRNSFLVLRLLAKGGIVKIHRGQGGGYSLTRDPKEITWLQIIEAVEGPLIPVVDGPEPVHRISQILHNAIEREACVGRLADLIKTPVRRKK